MELRQSFGFTQWPFPRRFRQRKRHPRSARDVHAIETVAKRLGNTKAVCRKCYIHPAVINTYLDGTLLQMLSRKVKKAMTITEQAPP
jgi:DNA topoisomerase IB